MDLSFPQSGSSIIPNHRDQRNDFPKLWGSSWELLWHLGGCRAGIFGVLAAEHLQGKGTEEYPRLELEQGSGTGVKWGTAPVAQQHVVWHWHAHIPGAR